MVGFTSTSACLLSLALSRSSLALPAPAPQASENPTVAPFPGASGSVRGSQSLAGDQQGLQVPTSPSTEISPDDFTLAPNQLADPELGLYIDLNKAKNGQPLQGNPRTPTDPGPRTLEYDRLNSDLFIPPDADSGDVPNAKWPFGLSHNRHGLHSSGWARQQNVDQLPLATAMAGVNMRLSGNAYRELHWHKQGEWALMLNGSVRISAMDENGKSFVDDVTAGDVWFFPPGIPHSIQAFENGCEFLLVFDDGAFSEDNTFLVSELFERFPKEVEAKNFRTDVKSFDNIPDGQLWIFNGTQPPKDKKAQTVFGPAGQLEGTESYSYHFSEQQPYEVPGGSIKIIDPVSFPVAPNFSAALITVEPGAMREMHWHINSDEWSYFLSGSARLTVYQAPESSRTFDFTAGDVGYVPVPYAHYIENTGNETLTYLEVLRASTYSDISVGQWLALTDKQIVEDHLHLPEEVYDNIPKTKPFVIPGNPNMSTTDFTGNPE